MSTSSDMHARHQRMLDELAELGLVLAADLQRRALAAEDDRIAAQLADSFHKVGRSVRQSLALDAKLARDQDLADREAQAEDELTRPGRIERRRTEVGAAVERLVWTEVDRSEFPFEDEQHAEVAVAMTVDALMEHLTDEDFADTPATALVARLQPDLVRVLNEILASDEDAHTEPELRNSA